MTDTRVDALDVDVYVHVLRTPTTGGVMRTRINRQLTVLNRAYAGDESLRSAASPFHFDLAAVDVTTNARWYHMSEGSAAEQHAKHALHEGDADDLNVYVISGSSGVLGWGTQPTRVKNQPAMDGIVVAHHTLPGSSERRYGHGDTAVHETGHWLGLFHTYKGGCTGPGDKVRDTPREARPAYDCPMLRNTCQAPGNDPIHNFMDAGTDACMDQFTKGQVARMVMSWKRYRA